MKLLLSCHPGSKARAIAFRRAKALVSWGFSSFVGDFERDLAERFAKCEAFCIFSRPQAPKPPLRTKETGFSGSF
jgi:hypothetical protein